MSRLLARFYRIRRITTSARTDRYSVSFRIALLDVAHMGITIIFTRSIIISPVCCYVEMMSTSAGCERPTEQVF